MTKTTLTDKLKENGLLLLIIVAAIGVYDTLSVLLSDIMKVSIEAAPEIISVAVLMVSVVAITGLKYFKKQKPLWAIEQSIIVALIIFLFVYAYIAAN